MVFNNECSDSLLKSFIGNSIASCTAEALAFPFITLKIRRQLNQNSTPGQEKLFKTGYESFRNLVRREGVSSLFAGLGQGFQRQLFYNGACIYFYDPVRTLYSKILDVPESEENLLLKCLSSTTIMAVATYAGHPLSFLKIHSQAGYGNTSQMEIIRIAYKERNFQHLWQGAHANAIRASMLNISDCISYDILLKYLRQKHSNERPLLLHIAATSIASAISVSICNPIDVIKTRYIQSVSKNHSIFQCAKRVYLNGGLRAFYKGGAASYCAAMIRNLFLLIAYDEIMKWIDVVYKIRNKV